jgi:lipid-binding SYLF domain-containing protein
MGFTLSKGAFLGSSVFSSAVKMNPERSDAVYGPRTKPAAILSTKVGKLRAAKELDIHLRQLVTQAW